MLEYNFPTQDSIYGRTRYSLDFGDMEVVGLTLSPGGFPIIDGTPIRDPSIWSSFMESKKIHLTQVSSGILDAFLKPLLDADQIHTLVNVGEVCLDTDFRVRAYRSQVKSERHFDSLNRAHKVNRLVNLGVFQSSPMPEHSILTYPVGFYNAYRDYNIPVPDMISYPSICRLYFLFHCYSAFWDLGKWTEDDLENQEILDFFKQSAPAPIQETGYAGLTERVKRLDFSKSHLHIIKGMPLLKPGYTWIDRTPGYSEEDLHGAHCISVYITPGRHKFSPLLGTFGRSSTPIPVEGMVEGAIVTQQTIEDLLWSGYRLEDITFHKSIRIKLRLGRGLVYPFKAAMDNLMEAEDKIDPQYRPKRLHQVAGGNFLATQTSYDEQGRLHHVAYPTYNPIYYSYIRGKAWSLVYRLTSILSNPLNRNPDEVYTTDKILPTILEGHPISLKGQEESLIQFDPYFKSSVGIGPELVDFLEKFPDKTSVKLIRDHIIGLKDVAKSGNLLSLGRQMEVTATLTPGVGHRTLSEKIPNIGSLEHRRFLGKNITPDIADKLAGEVRRYAHQIHNFSKE